MSKEIISKQYKICGIFHVKIIYRTKIYIPKIKNKKETTWFVDACQEIKKLHEREFKKFN